MKYKHLFFDMDGTITPSRSLILEEMSQLLSSLPQTITIVSGSTNQQMRKQVPAIPLYQLGQNGNHALDTNGDELWNTKLETYHKNEIFDHIQKITRLLDHELREEWIPIEDRGSQITFSPLGNEAPVELKKTYDPDRTKRISLLDAVPFESKELVVKIGGSTSIDYIHKDRHKGSNVTKLINLLHWNKDECVYFGDGLYPGGNDEAVIGIIDTVPVEDHHDTLRKLLNLVK